jgi:hypothetical protein
MAARLKNPNPLVAVNRSGPRRVFFFALVLLLAVMLAAPLCVEAQFAQIAPANTTNGYVARLLINETPFPGEYDYESEDDTKAAMLQVLWVLYSRINLIPARYTQRQVAGVRSSDVIDIITGTSDRPQCEGFYRDARGRFVTEPRVEERLKYLLEIANSGGRPGRFTRLLNYAQGLANAYLQGGIEEADRYAGLRYVGPVRVTGRGYSWMTDIDDDQPGGNFISIPYEDEGALGGNRFFTLRKYPQ